MSRMRFWPFERMYRLTPRGVWYEFLRWRTRRLLRTTIFRELYDEYAP